MSKTFEEIMSEIAAGLTGNNGEDLQYLISKGIEYSSHPYGKEITRAIGRLQYRILPEEIRDRVDEKTSENLTALRKKLEQADLCIFRKEYGQAEKIIGPMIRETEDAGLFIDDEVSEYHVFDDLFEEYGTNVELEQIKTTNLGTLYELTYSIDMKKGVDEKVFIDSLRCRNGNLNIVLCRLPERLEKL